MCLCVVCISEDPGKEPEHMVFIKLHIVESRLDYMGSSILMARVSDLAVKVNDEWHVDTGASRQEERRHSIATSRSPVQLEHSILSIKFLLMFVLNLDLGLGLGFFLRVVYFALHRHLNRSFHICCNIKLQAGDELNSVDSLPMLGEGASLTAEIFARNVISALKPFAIQLLKFA